MICFSSPSTRSAASENWYRNYAVRGRNATKAADETSSWRKRISSSRRKSRGCARTWKPRNVPPDAKPPRSPVVLLWRPVGILVRFVVVLHPLRGAILLMCTDLTLSPLDIIRIYGLRFKIEVSFKQALHVIGAYAYHFWMAAMTPLRRVSGNQYLHRKSDDYRDAVRRKIAAYHRYIQLGLIAQGLLQILSATI